MESNQDYPLARGYRAAARLNLQHYTWKQSAGYLVHPKILVHRGDGEEIRIADIGTGTGIWLLDLAASLPSSARLEGFDIDLSQCSPGQWLPTNVKMRQLNIYEEIPEDLLGVFDVIHIRYFLCVIKNGDVATVLRTLTSMLKPGGWIQWSEYDLKTIHIRTVTPDTAKEHTQALMRFVTSPTPGWRIEDQYWVADLHDSFTRANLQDVEEDRRKRLPWSLPTFQDLTILLAEELGLASSLSPASPGDDVHETIRRAAREAEAGGRGVAIDSEMVTVIGRKVGR